MSRHVRVAIAGTGFIGAVHARSARLAGARLVGVAASSPESARRAKEALRADHAFDSAEQLIQAPDVDVVHICTPNYLHVPLAEAALAHGKHVDEQLGGASRAFADIGSHWCDLAEFVSGHRITRLSARTLTALGERLTSEAHVAFESANGHGEPKRVTTEDAALIQFETAEGAVGSAVISQVSAGRKNRLYLELDGSAEALAFNQEEPETLWVGRREAATLIKRDPEHLTAAAARYATLPHGHPQGYGDCFDAFVAETYEAVRTNMAPEGLPVVADGLRAARITDAVLTSAREERWVDLTTEVAQPQV